MVDTKDLRGRIATNAKHPLIARLHPRPAARATENLPPYPEVSTVETALFCGYVVIWYLQIGYRYPLLGDIRFEFQYGAVLTILALFRGASLTSPLTGYLLALFALMVVQVPFSYDFETSYDVFIDRVVKFFMMSVFIVAFVKAPRQLRWFLGAFLLACLKMGQEGLVGKLSGAMIWENQGVMRLRGPTPLYGSPNSFAGMAVGTLPFLYYLFPISAWYVRALLLVMAALALNIILFTASRTGYVGFVAFLAAIGLKAKRRFKAVVVLAIVLSVALPLIPRDYIERFWTIFTLVEKEGRSAETRIEILRDAWAIFLDHPLGVGVSAFPAVRLKTFGRIQDTHNLYLEVATNLGIQGLVVFLLFVGAQLRLLTRLGRGFRAQIAALQGLGFHGADGDQGSRAASHVSDLQLMEQAAHAVQVFLIVRLALGLFGMDLYEIYWWFAMGSTIALFKMDVVAKQRTNALLESIPPGIAPRSDARRGP